MKRENLFFIASLVGMFGFAVQSIRYDRVKKEAIRWEKVATDQREMVVASADTVQEVRKNIEKWKPVIDACLAKYGYNPAEEKTVDPSETMAMSTISAQTIRFNYQDAGMSVELNNDGSVKVMGGTMDAATMLFWQRVTGMFPEFRKSICEGETK